MITIQDTFAPATMGIIVLSDMELALEYETNGIFARIINSLPDDAVRHGFELGISDDKILEFIESCLEVLNAVHKLNQAMRKSRLFGGALVVMFVEDGRNLTEPLDIKNAHRIADLRVYDRSEATPDYTGVYEYNAAQPWKTGSPEYYDITTASGGTFRVHESRCLIFTNGELVSQSMYQQYRFWGLPEYYTVARPLRNYVKANDMTTKMLERSVQPIYKGNMKEALTLPGGEEKIKKRMGLLSRIANRFRFVGVDKETEDISYAKADMTGINEVVRAAMNDLASVSRIPQTKLFGSSPGGLQSTGESDTENWHAEVEGYQELTYKPALITLIDIIVQEGLFSGKIEERPEIKFKFNPLKVLSELEQAQVELQKMQAAKQKADIAEKYCDMGALDPQEVRAGLAEDSEYQIEDLLDGDVGEIGGGLPNLQKLIREISGKGLKTDARKDTLRRDERWVTMNGSRVLLGDDGEVKGGLGGKYAGQNISSVGKKQGGDTRTAAQRISDGEKSIARNNRETAIVYDSNGNELFRIDGEAQYVDFTEEQLSQMEGMTVTHNHPQTFY